MKRQIVCLGLALSLWTGLASPALAAGFADVPEGHWARDSVAYVTEKGLFQGAGGDRFIPDAVMTRSMLAEVLYRYAGSPAVTGSGTYSDVPEGAYYRDAVTWAHQSGLYPDSGTATGGELKPDEAVQRGEFAVILYHFALLTGDSPAAEEAPAGPFSDMEGVDGEVRLAVLGWACPNGILTGTGETTMDPEGGVTRAEAAAMLARYDQTFRGTEREEAKAPDGLEAARQELVALTNGLRQEAGEAPLETDETLMAAAQIRAEECAAMDDLDNYNHVRPDGRPFYTVLGDRLTGYASENLAMVSALSAREAVTVWENSSGHYQNMVNPEITRIGVGVARSDSGLYYYCQIFTDG